MTTHNIQFLPDVITKFQLFQFLILFHVDLYVTMLSVLAYPKLFGNKTPLVFRRRPSMVKERGQGRDSCHTVSMAVKCRMLECLKKATSGRTGVEIEVI
jgi:hypothetical protein